MPGFYPPEPDEQDIAVWKALLGCILVACAPVALIWIVVVLDAVLTGPPA